MKINNVEQCSVTQALEVMAVNPWRMGITPTHTLGSAAGLSRKSFIRQYVLYSKLELMMIKK